MKLVVGLGNPGRDYENTRHNAGFRAIDRLAEHFGFNSFRQSDKHKAELAEGDIAGEKTLLVKPQTYMNLSGDAVGPLAHFYKVSASDVVVIYDEAYLPFGTLRVRPDGSAAGHNGLQSVIDALGGHFVRVRLGIQPEQPFPGALEDYVLGKLTAAEAKALDSAIDRLPDVIRTLFAEGIESARQQFN